MASKGSSQAMSSQGDQHSATASQLTADNAPTPASPTALPPSPTSDPLLQTKYRSQLYTQVGLVAPAPRSRK